MPKVNIFHTVTSFFDLVIVQKNAIIVDQCTNEYQKTKWAVSNFQMVVKKKSRITYYGLQILKGCGGQTEGQSEEKKGFLISKNISSFVTDIRVHF